MCRCRISKRLSKFILFIQLYSALEIFRLFIERCIALAVPSRKGKPRGLNAGKKKKIVEKLALLLPHKNRVFWHELPESENSKDLLGREGLK